MYLNIINYMIYKIQVRNTVMEILKENTATAIIANVRMVMEQHLVMDTADIITININYNI